MINRNKVGEMVTFCLFTRSIFFNSVYRKYVSSVAYPLSCTVNQCQTLSKINSLIPL